MEQGKVGHSRGCVGGLGNKKRWKKWLRLKRKDARIEKLKHRRKSFECIKQAILRDIRKVLAENREALIACDFQIGEKTRVGKNGEMFDDLLFETIYYGYIPVAYDDLIGLTRQEPVLVGSLIPSVWNLDNSSVLKIIRNNVINYLKAWVYERVGDLAKELR